MRMWEKRTPKSRSKQTRREKNRQVVKGVFIKHLSSSKCVCVCFSCGSQACGVCLMDTNHYCQMQHYNKQSALSSGGEAGVWVGGGGVAVGIMLFADWALFYLSQINWPMEETDQEAPRRCQLFYLQKQNITGQINLFHFWVLWKLFDRRASSEPQGFVFVESRQQYGGEDIFSRRCKPTRS